MSTSQSPQRLCYGTFKACAGGLATVPEVGKVVYYFAVGHAEYATSPPDFSSLEAFQLSALCRVTKVHLFADTGSDEVCAKISLDPLPFIANPATSPVGEGEGGLPGGASRNAEVVYYSKILTQSDANNGGGFSVPRSCADSVFPPLDYTEEPPAQILSILDLHGTLWKFRHIYRGSPRRHLFTTGWSKFVNDKKLVSGDTVVFIRDGEGQVFVGIRRTCRVYETLMNFPVRSAMTDKLEEIRKKSQGGEGFFWRSSRGRVSAESVVKAVRSAGTGQKFEVLYYPKIGSPDFVVAKELVDAAMAVPWATGMRVKMAAESDDSSMSCFQGVVSDIADRCLGQQTYPPWGLLQIKWDKEDAPERKFVNPWQIELALPAPYPTHTLSLPNMKKPRLHDSILETFEAQESIFPATRFISTMMISPYPAIIDLQRSLSAIQGARLNPSNNAPESIGKAFDSTSDTDMQDTGTPRSEVVTPQEEGNVHKLGGDVSSDDSYDPQRDSRKRTLRLFGLNIELEQ